MVSVLNLRVCLAAYVVAICVPMRAILCIMSEFHKWAPFLAPGTQVVALGWFAAVNLELLGEAFSISVSLSFTGVRLIGFLFPDTFWVLPLRRP